MIGPLQLDDLVSSFPDRHQEGLQTILSEKAEFADLESGVREPPPSVRGELFKHQEAVLRWMIHNDNLFLISDTGTGKTCTMSAISEYYRDRPGEIKHVYFLTSGDLQIDALEKQIICSCTDGRYDTEELKNAKSATGQTRIINANLKKWYTITTYTTFANKIMKDYPKTTDNHRITQDFSGCIFFIDEVQNIKIESDSEARRERERGDVYAQIWRVFHLMTHGKRVITSATPMMNNPDEMGPHLNLLLPADQQIHNNFTGTLAVKTGIISNGRSIDWDTVTTNELEPLIRGIVSYIRAPDTGVIPMFVGVQSSYVHTFNYDIFNQGQSPTDVPSQLVLDGCVMSKLQVNAYKRSFGVSESEHGTEWYMDQKKVPLLHKPRQVANWVFPNGTYGAEGFDKYVNQVGTLYTADPILKEWMSDPLKLGQMSCKGARIVHGATNEPGKRYIYSMYIRKGGGSIVLGLALEQHSPNHGDAKFREAKYTRFREGHSVFINDNADVKSYCPKKRGRRKYYPSTSMVDKFNESLESGAPLEDEDVDRRKIRPESTIRSNFHKAPRYAIISQDIPDQEREAIFELYNSPENAMGEYIQVIIISPVGQFGISLFDVLHIDIFTPEWTPSVTYQSRNRAFRIVSHVTILDYMRRVKRDPNYKPVVKIHYYASYIPIGGGLTIDTVEGNMYKRAERKDIMIRRIMRIFKKVAFDCYINHNVNCRSGDDGSQDCDYQKCNYLCHDPPPSDRIDDSSFKVFYKDTIIKRYTKFVRGYWKDHTYGTIDDMIVWQTSIGERILPSERNDEDLRLYYIYALKSMIKNRVVINGRIGMSCYIDVKNGTYYMSRAHPESNDTPIIDDAMYTNTFTARNYSTLSEIAAEYEEISTRKIRERIMTTSFTSENLSSIIAGLSPDTSARLLEDTLQRYLLPSYNINPEISAGKLTEIVLNYKKSLLKLKEPVSQLSYTANMISRGAAQKNIIEVTNRTVPSIDLSGIDMAPPANGNDVYIHNLYISAYTSDKRAIVTNYYEAKGRLRIFKPNEGFWRDLSIYEGPVYAKIFSNYIESLRIKFSNKYPIYGVFLTGGNFRIGDTRGTSKSRRGKECNPSNINITNLSDMLIYIDHPYKNVSVQFDKNKIIEKAKNDKINISAMDDEYLAKMNHWIFRSRSELTARIILHMYYNDTGIMIRTTDNEDPKLRVQRLVQSLGQGKIISDYDPDYVYKELPQMTQDEKAILYNTIQEGVLHGLRQSGVRQRSPPPRKGNKFVPGGEFTIPDTCTPTPTIDAPISEPIGGNPPSGPRYQSGRPSPSYMSNMEFDTFMRNKSSTPERKTLQMYKPASQRQIPSSIASATPATSTPRGAPRIIRPIMIGAYPTSIIPRGTHSAPPRPSPYGKQTPITIKGTKGSKIQYIPPTVGGPSITHARSTRK